MFDFPSATHKKALENQGLKKRWSRGEYNRTLAAVIVLYKKL
jgi:hypothetical protein